MKRFLQNSWLVVMGISFCCGADAAQTAKTVTQPTYVPIPIDWAALTADKQVKERLDSVLSTCKGLKRPFAFGIPDENEGETLAVESWKTLWERDCARGGGDHPWAHCLLVALVFSRSEDGHLVVNLYRAHNFNRWLATNLDYGKRDFVRDPVSGGKLFSKDIYYFRLAARAFYPDGSFFLCTLDELIARDQHGEDLRAQFRDNAADDSDDLKNVGAISRIRVENGEVKEALLKAEDVSDLDATRRQPVVPQGDDDFARRLQENERQARERLEQARREEVQRQERARQDGVNLVNNDFWQTFDQAAEDAYQRSQQQARERVEAQRREAERQRQARYDFGQNYNNYYRAGPRPAYDGGGHGAHVAVAGAGAPPPPYLSYAFIGLIHGLCNNYLSDGAVNKHFYRAPWREWGTAILFRNLLPRYEVHMNRDEMRKSALVSLVYSFCQVLGEIIPPIALAPHLAITGPWRNIGVNSVLVSALLSGLMSRALP